MEAGLDATFISSNHIQAVTCLLDYGVHGSGIVRVDGWFYECAKKSTCSLFALANLGLSRNLKNYPDVTYQAPYLLIGSPDANQIKIRLK